LTIVEVRKGRDMVIMIDLESCATTHDAVILQIAAVKFDPKNPDIEMDGRLWHLDVEEQVKLGRHVCDDTMAWWAEQGEEAIESVFGESIERTPLTQAMDEFHKFVWGHWEYWAQGPVFDFPIIESLLRQIGKPDPWSYQQVRDSRTLFKLGIPYEYYNPIKHNALSDAFAQAIAVQQIFEKLKVFEDESGI
jgi:hypothetical protein